MQDSITGVIAILVFMAFFTGLLTIVALIIKKVKEAIDSQRVIGEARDRLEDLEEDYKWRRIKVVYIVIATIVTAIITLAVFSIDTSKYSYSDYQSNPGGGFFALLVCAGISWLIYALVLTRLYTYLKKPDLSKK